MIPKLLATTAIVSIVTFGGTAAWAQDAQPPAQDQMTIEFTQTQLDNSRLASNLIGAEVYSSASDNAESIGDIQDLVLSEDGLVDSVVIGVGGFLGVGEKDVAIQYNSLEWADRQDGEAVVVLNTTREQLESAPAFEYAADQPETLPDTRTSAVERMDRSPPAEGQATTETAPAGQMAQGGEAGLKTPDFSSMTTAEIDKVTAGKLVGAIVYGSDDGNIGEVGDLVLNADGSVDAVILDVGGFLGMGEKPVAIGFEALEILADQDGNLVLRTDFTQDELEAAPEYDEEGYKTDRDSMRLTMNQSTETPAESAR